MLRGSQGEDHHKSHFSKMMRYFPMLHCRMSQISWLIGTVEFKQSFLEPGFNHSFFLPLLWGMNTHTRARTHTYTRMHARTRMQAHTHMHACRHVHTHMHTHARCRTDYLLINIISRSLSSVKLLRWCACSQSVLPEPENICTGCKWKVGFCLW